MVTVQRAFHVKYAKYPPTDKTIIAWYKQFSDAGRMCKRKSSGRTLTAEDDVERFRSSFQHSPKKSLVVKRKLSCGCEQFHQCKSFIFLAINVHNH